ncbi:MAG: hypothetical protein ABII02_01630 [Candidatus Magasanikbacteria bacterium]
MHNIRRWLVPASVALSMHMGAAGYIDSLETRPTIVQEQKKQT